MMHVAEKKMLGTQKIIIIGAGNMGEALIHGTLAAELTAPEYITATDVRDTHLDHLKRKYNINVTRDNDAAINLADIIILAVKPQVLPILLKASGKQFRNDQLVISIAAGVRLAGLSNFFQNEVQLVRAMPNMGVSIQAGVTAIVGNSRVTPKNIQIAKSIFSAVGACLEIHDEHLMDVITGLSGSGPAYFFMIADAIADGGVKMGMTKPDALFFAANTMLGAARLLLETGEHPAVLKDKISSPGGTTIHGLSVMEKNGLRSILMETVQSATQRSQALGDKLTDFLS